MRLPAFTVLIALTLFGASHAKNIHFVLFETVGNTSSRYTDSPQWDPEAKALYYTEVLDGQLVRHDPVAKTIQKIKFGCELRTAIPVEGSPTQLVVGCGSQLLLATVTWGDKPTLVSTKVLADVAKAGKGKTILFSHGRVDPTGAIVVGIKADAGSGSGSIRRFQVAKDSVRGNEKLVADDLDTGFSPVSIEWSPNLKQFYTVDADKRKVYVYDFDKHTGKIANRKDFLDFAKNKLAGTPSGILVDAANTMWILCADAAKVLRFTLKETGGFVQVHDDPLTLNTPLPTALTFGDVSLSELYVTSARSTATKEQLKNFPLTGSVFKFSNTKKGQGQVPRKAKLFK